MFRIFLFVNLLIDVRAYMEFNCQPECVDHLNAYYLGLLFENRTLTLIEQGESIKVFPVDKINIKTTHGSLARKPQLHGTLEMDCMYVQALTCKMEGYDTSSKDTEIVDFLPKVRFNDTVINPIISPHKTTIRKGDVALVQCSADIGVNHTHWKWDVRKPGSQAHQDIAQVDIWSLAPILRNCSYHVVSKMVSIPEQTGKFEIRCQTKGNTIGAVTILVTDEEGDHTGGPSSARGSSPAWSLFSILISVLVSIFGGVAVN